VTPKEARELLSQSGLRFSSIAVRADNFYEIAGGFECLFGVVVRIESGDIMECRIPFPPETVEDGQQASMFFVNARPDKFADHNVMPRLALGTEPVAEYASERFH
jgi:hypothetical protein